MARATLVPITLPADPANALEAATKQYTDGKVAKTGDTMTGRLIVQQATWDPPAITAGAADIRALTTNISVGGNNASMAATNNTNIGIQSLNAITSGSYNTAAGHYAGYGITTGTQNTAVGQRTLFSNSTGSYNTAIGFQACTSGAAPAQGVMVGINAGYAFTGTTGTFIGASAGYNPGGVTANQTTSSNNSTFVGAETGANSTTQSNNQTAIGYRALVDGHYATALGSTTKAIHAGGVALGVDSGGGAATTTANNEIRLGTLNHNVVVAGKLTLAADPGTNLEAATKQYVDGKVGGGGFTRSVNSISGNTTLGSAASTDYVYACTAALTATLPTAVGNTNRYTVKSKTASNVTVATTASQTIDGASTFVLDVQYMAIDLISDGANWMVV